MKKRTILSIAVALIVFAAIVFQLHKEAIAETESDLPLVMVYSIDGLDHGPYTAELVNLTTRQIIPLSQNRKGGIYPSVFGGNGGGDLQFNSNHNYLIHVCSQILPWGVNSSIFHMPATTDFVLTAGSGCPVYVFNNH